jgi:hypothetical protein
MSSSQVTFGGERGSVTALDGSTISALVTGPSGPMHLDLQLDLGQGTGVVSGTVSGTPAR